MRVLVGLGSNLGERWSNLAAAIAGLSALDANLRVSPVYETEPVGGPPGQGRYLNCVVDLQSEQAPEELLVFAHRLEDEAGRVRRERNGPRTLDVDLLLIEGHTSDDPQLTLPHPRLFERAFALAPLEDLDSTLVDRDWRARLGGEIAVNAEVRQVGEILAWPGPDARGEVSGESNR